MHCHRIRCLLIRIKSLQTHFSTFRLWGKNAYMILKYIDTVIGNNSDYDYHTRIFKLQMQDGVGGNLKVTTATVAMVISRFDDRFYGLR